MHGFFKVWAVTCKECTVNHLRLAQNHSALRNKRWCDVVMTSESRIRIADGLKGCSKKWPANELISLGKLITGQWFQLLILYGMEITASDVFWKHVAIQNMRHSWGEKGELPWDFPNDLDRHNFKRTVVYPMFILATMRSCEFQSLKISFQQIMISCQTPSTPKKKRVKNLPTWWIRLVFFFPCVSR